MSGVTDTSNLLRENAWLHERLTKAETQLAAARRDNELLREDAARVDYLEEHLRKLRRYHAGGAVMLMTKASPNMRPGKPTIREAIDDARKDTR